MDPLAHRCPRHSSWHPVGRGSHMCLPLSSGCKNQHHCWPRARLRPRLKARTGAGGGDIHTGKTSSPRPGPRGSWDPPASGGAALSGDQPASHGVHGSSLGTDCPPWGRGIAGQGTPAMGTASQMHISDSCWSAEQNLQGSARDTQLILTCACLENWKPGLGP